MYPVNADQRVLGYLGRALSLELSAVQLYSTQAMLVASWGLADVAEKFRADRRRAARGVRRDRQEDLAAHLALGSDWSSKPAAQFSSPWQT